MVKIFKFIVLTLFGASLTNCATLVEVGNAFASEYTKYVENNDDDPFGMQDVALAWQKGGIGKGLLVAEAGLNVVDEFVDSDLSNITDIVKGTRKAYTADDKISSNATTTDVLSTIFHGADEAYNVLIVPQKEAELEEEWATLLEEASDPRSHRYDPYFEFRYELDYEKMVIRKRDFADVMKDIEEAQVRERDRELIEYGIVSDSEYETYFGSEALRVEYEDKYRQCLAELRQARSYDRLNQNNNVTSMPEATESEAVEELSIVEEQEETVSTNSNNVVELISGLVADKYAFDVYTLSEEQKVVLNNLSNILKENPAVNITITGHTCHIGSDKANANVGLRRANCAKQYLVDCGIEGARIKTQTAGNREPVAATKDLQGRLANRRITFSVDM